MSESAQALADALRAWTSTFDTAGQVDMVNVIVQPESPASSTTIQLREIPHARLVDLLLSAGDARVGDVPIGDGSYSMLQYAASRLSYLLGHPSGPDLPGRGLRDPEDAAEALLLVQAAVTAAAETADEVITSIRDDLQEHHLMGASRSTENSEAAKLIREAREVRDATSGLSTSLSRAQEVVAGLRRASAADLAETRDGSTLQDQFVLECVLGSAAGPGRYHVRVYEHPESTLTVVLGDLADNHSISVTNGVERLISLLRDHILQLPGPTSNWIQYEPAERLSVHPFLDSDRWQIVGILDPLEVAEPKWSSIRPAEVERMVGGPVRRWHARTYTSTRLRRDGVRIVTPPKHRVGGR